MSCWPADCSQTRCHPAVLDPELPSLKLKHSYNTVAVNSQLHAVKVSAWQYFNRPFVKHAFTLPSRVLLTGLADLNI